MAQLLLSKEVNAPIKAAQKERCERLRKNGVIPTLGIIRAGGSPEDDAYIAGIERVFGSVGIEVTVFESAPGAGTDEVLKTVKEVGGRKDIHAMLLLKPLPRGLDERAISDAIPREKDADAVSELLVPAAYLGKTDGFLPCKAAAVMRILDHYGIDPAGKRAVVVGRSMVVGKPAAMLLLSRNATVTICHSKTQNLPGICREADIIVAAAGVRGLLGRDCFAPGQTVIDAGINIDENGKLCGDVCFEEAEPIVKAITPVPGGVGGVTTVILAGAVLDAAEKTLKE